MSEHVRAKKSAPETTQEPRSGVRPVARIPGEGTVLLRASSETGTRQRRGLSPRTREVYRRDWGRFASWCKANRVQALPCRPETLIRYLDERAAEATRTVLFRELIVICRTHRAEGERSPRQFPLVRKWLRNYSDDPGLARPAATPIQSVHFRAMTMRLFDAARGEGPASADRKRLAALRDRALFVIARGARLRRLELRKLLRSDFRQVDDGLEVTIRRSKSQGGPTTTVLARHDNEALCPVRAWGQWIEAAPEAPEAPAFPLMGSAGLHAKPMSPTDVCIALKRAIHAVGVDPTPYTDDSLAAS